MGVQLNDDELVAFLESSHTMVLSTIRQSGAPWIVPLWFVYLDGAIFFSTPDRSSKVQHLKRDNRACCLIEEGEAWIDLKAVVLSCEAEFVEAGSVEALEYQKRFGKKYAAFKPKLETAPQATRSHYDTGMTIVKLIPIEREIRSWYNRKIRGLSP